MDGLRGLAALAVVAFHLKSFGIYPAGLGMPAVDLFFMMSGFVIADAYAKLILWDRPVRAWMGRRAKRRKAMLAAA